jgi:hypothetical protein
MMRTTLNQIHQRKLLSDEDWGKLLTHLGKPASDDEPLPLLTALDALGLSATLLCLAAVNGHVKEKRLLAVSFARRVQHLMKDPRSVAALDVAERHANGEATDEELAAADSDAHGAAWDTEESASRATALGAAQAAAAWAANSAAMQFASNAALYTAEWAESALAALSARSASADPASERAAQEKILREMLTTTN